MVGSTNKKAVCPHTAFFVNMKNQHYFNPSTIFSLTTTIASFMSVY